MRKDNVGTSVSYCFSGVVIGTDNKKHLAMPADTTYEIHTYLSDVENDDHFSECEKKELRHADIVAVTQHNNYQACLSCKGNVDELSSSIFGHCIQCKTPQHLENCQDILHFCY